MPEIAAKGLLIGSPRVSPLRSRIFLLLHFGAKTAPNPYPVCVLDLLRNTLVGFFLSLFQMGER